MRKRIFVAVMALAILAAAGGIAWWSYHAFFAPVGGVRQVDVSTVFRRVDLNDVCKIEVETTDKYTLQKKNGAWSVEGQQIVLSEERLKRFLEAVGTLHAYRIADHKLSTAEREEFDRRKVGSVTVSDADDVLYKLLIGSFSEENGSYYVMLSDQKKLYEMHEEAVRIFLQPLNELRDHHIHHIDGERLKQDRYLKSYQLQRPGKPFLSIRAKTNDELAKSKDGCAHLMQSPYIRDIDTEEFHQQILVKLSMLTVKNFVEKEPQDLSQYGLTEEERSVLQVVTEEQTLVLYIGKTQGGECYMQKAGESEVFTVEQEAASFLNIDPFYLLEPSLDMPELSEINRMEIRGKQGSYSITIPSQRDGKTACSVNNRSVAYERLNEWYTSAMLNLTVSGVLAATTEQVEPDVTITLTYASTGNQHTVYFYSVNDLQYAVYINREHGFSIEKKQIEQVFSTLKNIAS